MGGAARAQQKGRGATAWFSDLRLLFAAALVAAALIRPAFADQQSVYDPAGRLVGVIDPVNGSAQYSYDAAGNILSVTRQPISTLVVMQFTPASAPVGSTVMIAGTAFDTASDTTVSFNGTPATPTAVTPTQITVAVPSGATTGPITVTSPAGTVTTAASFTVGTPLAPTIASFSPTTLAIGDSLTIAGTNLGTNFLTRTYVNQQLAQISSASGTAITETVPSASSGRVTVETPDGTATSTSDLIVAPPDYLASAVNSAVRGALAQTTSIAASGPGKVSLILFDATAGQRTNLLFNLSSSLTNYSIVSLQAPDGSYVVSPTNDVSTNWYSGPLTLSETGTYSAVVAPNGSISGTVTLTPFAVPADAAGTVTAGGGATSLSITTPGQHASFSFSGTAGQRVSWLFDFSKMNGCSYVSVLNPDGTTFLGSTLSCSSLTFMSSPYTLAQSGTYTVQITPSLSGSGAASTWGTGTTALTLFSVPADATGMVTAGGGATSLSITTPGQHASFSFSGTAGQRVSWLFDFSKMNGCSYVSVLNPDGTTFLGSTLSCSSLTFLSSPYTLVQSGTYTVQLTPSLSGSGAASTWGTGTTALTLFSVPADATNTVTAGGGASSLSITTPGQHASFTFGGTAGQRVSWLFDFSKMNGCSYVSVLNPDGTTFLGSTLSCSSLTFMSSPYTLAQSGTYTVQLTPSLSGSGAASTWGTGTTALTLFSVPADATNSVSIGGPSESVTIATPGQHGDFTFSATAGQKVGLVLNFSQMTSCNYFSVLNPDNSTLISQTLSCSTSYSTTVTLAQTGTYTLQIKPSLSGSGSASTWGTGTTTATLSLSS